MSNQTRCLACMADMRDASACPVCGWQMSSDMDNALYLPAGHLLNNRYTIGKVIGVGGFGIVYIAWDTNLDIRVAVKEFLPKEYAGRSSNHISIVPYTGSAIDDFSLGVEKFLDEAKALARFQDHPGIVTVHESFRTSNTAYMVMQYLDGMTMKEYLKRQPGEKIAYNVAVKAMTPIMDALREVHNAGFVHRDISPDNIFLTNQNQVKLLDFGSARYAIGEHSKSLTSILKHGYAPVEQYSVKGKQGPWSDVYAVCATLYRCVTGYVPIDAMERIQEDTIKSPKEMGIIMPENGAQAIMRGLALKAANRFENIQQLQQALATGEQPGQQQVGNWSVLSQAIQDAEAAQQHGQDDVIQPHRPQKNIIVCPNCGAKNQLHPGDDPNALRCGKCKSELGRKTAAAAREIQVVQGPATYIDPTADIELVFVKGGCFQMGDTFGDGNADEKPVHEVCVRDFYLGKNEVTVGEFSKFVNDTGYRTEAEKGDGCYAWTGSKWEKKSDGNWRNPGFSQNDNHPAVCVSWNDAQSFIGWLSKKSGKNYRLPTEAEWEYAARSGGKKEKYSGTNSSLDDYAWYNANSGNKTHPAVQKKPNGLGIYDMTGNVWEWCSDWYGDKYYGESPRDNPRGHSSGSYRVLRGGCWVSNAPFSRVANRGWYDPDGRDNSSGFRLCASIQL